MCQCIHTVTVMHGDAHAGARFSLTLPPSGEVTPSGATAAFVSGPLVSLLTADTRLSNVLDPHNIGSRSAVTGAAVR